jgi:hypothetical protein
MAKTVKLPHFADVFIKPVISEATKKRESNEIFHLTLKGLLQSFSGLVYVTCNPALETPFMYADGQPVRTLTWIVPFVEHILQRCQYIELDASFKAGFPYVYCVPQAIIDNESVPLGFVIGPTERAELYLEFYASVQASSTVYEDLLKIPVVTDEGTGVTSFCKQLGLRQFLCFKHVLTKFGNLTPLYHLVRRILYSTTQKKFEQQLPLILEIAKNVLLKSHAHQEKFEEIVGYHFNWDTGKWKQFTTPFAPNYFWNRAAQNIGVTTNHAERFHRTLNEGCRKKSCMLRKSLNLRTCITKKICHFNTFPVRRQLVEHILRLQKKAQKHNVVQKETCDQCNTLIFAARFQFEVPCIHTCLAVDVKAIPKVAEIPLPVLEPEAVVLVDEIVDDWTVQLGVISPSVEAPEDEVDDQIRGLLEIDPLFQTLAYECAEHLHISSTPNFALNIQGMFWEFRTTLEGTEESIVAAFTEHCWEEARKGKSGVFKFMLPPPSQTQ